MLKSDRLVCEKNATKAQPVTKLLFGSINSVNLNYEKNLSIICGKIVTKYLCLQGLTAETFTKTVKIGHDDWSMEGL